MAKLTETFINKAAKEVAATGKRIEYADDAQTGLRLSIGSQKSMWLLVCRKPNGTVGRFRIGAYPGLTLSDARIKARRQRELIRDGHDPIAANREVRSQRKRIKESMRLSDLFERYTNEGTDRRSWPDCRKKVEAIFSSLLGKSLLELTVKDVQTVLDTHPKRKYAAWGMRMIRPMLKWATASGRGYVSKEVCDLQLQVGVGKRERVLSDGELRSILNVVNDQVGNGYMDCIKLLALTALRRSEGANLKWDQVDLTEKLIRLPITKNGQPLTLPLSRQAITLLEHRKEVASGNLVFHFDCKPLVSWPYIHKKLLAASDTSDWQFRDVRRTGATLLAHMGFDPHVIEAALNHAVIHSPIASIYNRSRYLPQVRVALQSLADRLDAIASENVIVFPGQQVA
jgi:integrase